MGGLNAERVRELFEQLMQLPANQRTRQQLQELCSDDLELQQAVWELFEAGQAARAQDFLNPAQEPANPARIEPADQSREFHDVETIETGNETSAKHSQATPHALGRFQNLEWIGQGSFGTVYRAYDPQLDRPIAVKVLRLTGDTKKDELRIQRFLVEGRASARLRHPHIVAVFDAGYDEASESYFQAAAYISGCTLTAAIKTRKVPIDRSVQIVRQLAGALDYAHSQGVLHRDVKPDNVMLDENGDPHLMDFGLARIEESPEQITQDGTLVGTPAYMSPEQALGENQALTPASDQYGLGCLFYELLTGRPPFTGPPAVQIHHHQHQPPEQPAGLARDLITICLKTLAKKPTERYPNCLALAEDLRRFQAGEPIQARPLNLYERFYRWCRREPVVAGLVMAIFLVFTIGLAVSSWQWQRASVAAKTESEARAELEQREQDLRTANAAAEEARNREIVVLKGRLKDFQEQKNVSRNLYSARILAASQALDAGDLSQAWTSLESANSRTDRTFEWFHLAQKIQLPRIREISSLDISFAPNGQLFATYDFLTRNIVAVKETSTGTMRNSLDVSPAHATAFKFTPDGRELVIGDSAGNVTLWDFQSGAKRVLNANWPIRRLDISRDGSRIVCGGRQREKKDGKTKVRNWEAQVWSVDRGEVVQVISPLPLVPVIMTLSPDGSLLAVGFRSASSQLHAAIRLWDVESGHRRHTFLEHKGTVTGLLFSPKGDSLISSGKTDATIRVWDVRTRETTNSYFHRHGSVTGLALASAVNICAALCDDGTVLLWNFKTNKHRALSIGNTIKAQLDEHISQMLISDNGRLLATRTGLRSRLWDCSAAFHNDGFAAHSQDVRAVAFSPDGEFLASGGLDGTMRIWDTSSKELFKDIDEDQGSVRCLTYSPDGAHLLSSTDQAVALWNTSDWTHNIIYQSKVGTRAAFAPDGKLIAIATSDNRTTTPTSISLWSVSENEIVCELAGHQSAVEAVAFSADGRFLASSGRDRTVRIWSLATRKEFQRLDQTSVPLAIEFSADGSMLAAGSELGTIQIWNVQTGKPIRSMAGSRDRVESLAFLSNDRTLVGCGRDGMLRFWDPESGIQRMSLAAHQPYVWCLTVSQDGRTLATGGADGRVRIWETANSLDEKETATE